MARRKRNWRLFVVCASIFVLLLIVFVQLSMWLHFLRTNSPYKEKATSIYPNVHTAVLESIPALEEQARKKARLLLEDLPLPRSSQVSVVADWDFRFVPNEQDVELSVNAPWRTIELDWEHEEQVRVVMWDNLRDRAFHWNKGDLRAPNYVGINIKKPQCRVSCHWTTNRSERGKADGILFDPCYWGPHEWEMVPPYLPEKLPGQQWLWFAYETPNYFPLMLQGEYMNQFDHKITYQPDAMVHISHMCAWAARPIETYLLPPPPKTKMGVFMASNCDRGGAHQRTSLVKALSHYIHVDSLGPCLRTEVNPLETIMKERAGKRGVSFGERMDVKIKTLQPYKFSFAFENSATVPDYVTEKIATAWLAGTVPVYWGAENVEEWAPGDHSFIDARDFASPKALAKYLKKVAKDDALYNSYFAWKEQGLRARFVQNLEDCLVYAECNVCESLARIRNATREAADEEGQVASNWIPFSTSSAGLAREREQRVEHAGPAWIEEQKNSVEDGFALSLNGLEHAWVGDSEASVTVRHSPSLNVDNHLTLAAWIRMRWVHKDGRIIDKSQSGQLNGYSMDIFRARADQGLYGVLRFCGQPACVTGQRPLYTGQWYHVAVTYQNEETKSTVRLFVNGKLDVEYSSENAPPLEQNNFPLVMGYPGKPRTGWQWRPMHGEGTFDGWIDDVSVWGRTLNALEVSRLRFRRQSGKERELRGYWPFVEGQGVNVRDFSPYGNHGLIHGKPVEWVPSTTKPVMDVVDARYGGGRKPDGV